ncbi:MAG: EamA family transporter [bacterium]
MVFYKIKEISLSPVHMIIMAVVLGVIGQLLNKKGLNLLGHIDFTSNLFGAYAKIVFSPYVIIGSLIYLVSVFFWLFGLAKVDLSFAYPFLALSYVLVVLASWLFLGEQIPLLRWIGVLVICFGVFLISKS